MATNTAMHVYNPRTEWIPPRVNSDMSHRDRLYVRVRRTYELGHYEEAQALYHLLEDGVETPIIDMWWERLVAQNPMVVCQSSNGGSIRAMRG